MLLTAPWQVRQPKCAICITVIYYAYCCCFFSLSGGGLRLLMPRFNGSYTFKCEKSCPNTWISIRARWVHPWETNQDLSFFNTPLSPYSLGLGTLHLLSSHFSSINLSQWDITIEFLCQVTLLWWLKKNAAAITTKDTGPKMRGGKKKKKKNTYSSAHIPPHSVALSATQMMMYLERCGGHQHVWRPTHLNCKIGRACWPTSFRSGRISSVFSHPTRSEATPSPPLISQ